MKKIKSILAIVLLITAPFFITHFSFAQGCCGAGSSCSKGGSGQTSKIIYAPHGGEVKAVGKYQIEMVFSPLIKQDPLTFYLMSKKGKPLNDTTVTGKAEFTFQDVSIAVIELEPRGENSYAVQLSDRIKSFICLVTFQINGENVMARFDSGISKSNTLTTKVIYTCPMHPEVRSDKMGQCPKYAMGLVKK